MVANAPLSDSDLLKTDFRIQSESPSKSSLHSSPSAVSVSSKFPLPNSSLRANKFGSMSCPQDCSSFTRSAAIGARFRVKKLKDDPFSP